MNADLTEQCVLVRGLAGHLDSDQVARHIASFAGVPIRAVAPAKGGEGAGWTVLLFSVEDAKKCLSLAAKHGGDFTLHNVHTTSVPSDSQWILVDDEVLSGMMLSKRTEIKEPPPAAPKKKQLPPPVPPKQSPLTPLLFEGQTAEEVSADSATAVNASEESTHGQSYHEGISPKSVLQKRQMFENWELSRVQDKNEAAADPPLAPPRHFHAKPDTTQSNAVFEAPTEKDESSSCTQPQAVALTSQERPESRESAETRDKVYEEIQDSVTPEAAAAQEDWSDIKRTERRTEYEPVVLKESKPAIKPATEFESGTADGSHYYLPLLERQDHVYSDLLETDQHESETVDTASAKEEEPDVPPPIPPRLSRVPPESAQQPNSGTMSQTEAPALPPKRNAGPSPPPGPAPQSPKNLEQLAGLSKTQRMVLETKEVSDIVKVKLQASDISGVWTKGAHGKTFLRVNSPEDRARAHQIIHQTIIDRHHNLTPESAKFLQTEEWMKFMKGLFDKYPGTVMVTPSQNGGQICVTCTNDIIDTVSAQVSNFIQTNTVEGENFCFSPSRQKFVRMFLETKLSEIQNELKDYKIKISLDRANDNICVEGNREGLVLARTRLENLGEQILCHEERLTERSQVKFLRSPQFRTHADLLERACQCVVSLERERHLLMACGSGQRQKTLEVSIVVAEIAMEKVDVIVSPTVADLDLSKGTVSGAILKVAGSSLQEESRQSYPRGIRPGEIAVTQGHGLTCKQVYHITLDAWSPDAEKTLSTVIFECFQKASAANFSTIAIPALETGNLDYPGGTVAQTIFCVLSQFQQAVPTSSLREVRIVLHENDRQTIQAFYEEQKLHQQNSNSAGPLSTSPTAKTGMKIGEIQVSIVEGEIAKEWAHVIVNSTSPTLDLSRGAVSASILKAGSSNMQAECRLKYPSGVRPGEIAHTRGHGLSCREVYHLTLTPRWSPVAQQTLRTVLYECLERASKSQYTTIAFPALGTGKLGYPPDEVAQTVFSVVSQFQQDVPTSSLRKVKIVLLPDDQATIQVFRAAQSQSLEYTQYGSSQPPSREPPAPTEYAAPKSLPPAREQEVYASVQSLPVEASFSFWGLALKLVQGDITQQDVDLLVVGTDSNLNLAYDATARHLKSLCEPEWERDLRKQVPKFQKTGVLVSYNRKSGMVLFVDYTRFVSNWKWGIAKCLREADSQQNLVKSVAMPPLGAGGLSGADLTKRAKSFFKAVTKFCTGKRQSVTELRVVTDDLSLIRCYSEVIKQKLNKKGIKHGCQENLPSTTIKGEPSAVPLHQQYQQYSPLLEKGSLFIYSDKEENVTSALSQFREFIMGRFAEKTLIDDKLKSLNEHQLEKIRQAGQCRDVNVLIHPLAGSLTLKGEYNDVIETLSEVKDILTSVHREIQEARAAGTIARIVQWCYLEVSGTTTEQREFGQRENLIIEEAFQNHDRTVKIAANGVTYVIDFEAMNKFQEHSPTELVSVIRRANVAGATKIGTTRLPATWTSQHAMLGPVGLIPVDPSDDEYQQVVANFMASLTTAIVKIKSVQRIENSMLYLQYQTKKVHLEKQNVDIENEKTLWHGTSPNAIDNINRYGFNRSYCGRNATKHGQGVYFAVRSSYSATPAFSSADASGNRYIYQCKVLVGHPTKGSKDMRVLPCREGPTLYDSATDDLVRPELYVIFNDTQAYPEFLITFNSFDVNF